VLGAPDINLLTATELAEQCHRIGRAGRLPLIVDADTGFGHVLNVMRCVEELERAGVAALTIEDSQFPAPSAGRRGLAAPDEAAARMRAAVAARGDPGLAIVGRTDALALGGLDDAVARVRAYSETGIDAIFVASGTRAQVEAAAAATPLPLMLGSFPPELQDPDVLARNRVRIVMQGHLPLAAAIQAVYRTLKAVRLGVPADDIPDLASAELIRRVTRADRYDMLRRDCLQEGGCSARTGEPPRLS
jgi:carboxyvinyl-carboxyphosphonate phosphorylmutase